jgi:KaiC/GvpD/RAD55 family RecA-like ATPase
LEDSELGANLLIKGEPGTGKTRLIHHLIKGCRRIVWISTLKSAERVRSEFSRSVDLYVVDAHTWQRRATHMEKDIVVQNPINLNEVSLAINRTIGMVKRNYCLVLDSLSGLLLYHKAPNIIQFLRGILVRLEDENGSGIFTLTKNAHELPVEVSLTMIFDNVIELEREYSDGDINRSIKLIKLSKYLDYSQVEYRIERDGMYLTGPLMKNCRIL